MDDNGGPKTNAEHVRCIYEIMQDLLHAVPSTRPIDLRIAVELGYRVEFFAFDPISKSDNEYMCWGGRGLSGWRRVPNYTTSLDDALLIYKSFSVEMPFDIPIDPKLVVITALSQRAVYLGAGAKGK